MPSKTKRYIITLAQNATPVHADFFEALKRFPAKLIVLAGRYKNPTSVWSSVDRNDQWYDAKVLPYLLNHRQQLCKNLCVYGDIHIRPTAKRPLTGWEVFCGKNSAIFGHPKHALEVIPTANRTPRVVVTTGACTIPNYTDSRAGKHGEAHHILGALVVEIDRTGTYYIRHINAESNGEFIDLDKKYSKNGITKAPAATAIAMGDIHAGSESVEVLKATEKLSKLLNPQYLFLHDVLDFRSQNHHDTGSIRKKINKQLDNKLSVEQEVKVAASSVSSKSKWAKKVCIVRSNHDEAFENFLERSNPHTLDAENIHYYFSVWTRMLDYKKKYGEFPDAFQMEASRLGVPSNVRFLKRNEDVTLQDVSYGFHGDFGINGSKGTPHAYAKLGVKTVTGHTHSPTARDGNFTAGISAELDQGYNNLPSTWAHAHVVQYGNGKRTHIFITKGKFRV